MLGVVGKGGRLSVERKEEFSPAKRTLQVCGIAPGTKAYRDNYRSFSSVMMKLELSRSIEAVMMFESEIHQREHASVRNLAAVLMARLIRLV